MNLNSLSSDAVLILSTFSFSSVSPPPVVSLNPSIQQPISWQPLEMYRSPVTNALWLPRSKIFETIRNPPTDYISHQSDELIKKTPSQSRTCILYKFSSDYSLREHYKDPWNEFRFGKLLEDLDALASTVATKHCFDDCHAIRPSLLVTASVDKIILKRAISVELDLQITGAVIWVGRSSMEIQLQVIQPTPGLLLHKLLANGRTHRLQEDDDASDSVVLTANLIFVACDVKSGKASPVNQLQPETELEKFLFSESERKNKLRKGKKMKYRKKFEQSGEDMDINNKVKALVAKGRILSDTPAFADKDNILISHTQLESSLVCQPQHRNMHGRIFGGFLMHRAFELAFSTAYAFAETVPCFLEVDHIEFLRPVDVGDFVRFRSLVLYSRLENPNQPLITVEVVAHVTRPELRSSEVSNTFYFTFTVRSKEATMDNDFKIRTVVPSTEEEARHILERMDIEKS